MLHHLFATGIRIASEWFLTGSTLGEICMRILEPLMAAALRRYLLVAVWLSLSVFSSAQPATLIVSPTSLTFNQVINGPEPSAQNLNVTSSGGVIAFSLVNNS